MIALNQLKDCSRIRKKSKKVGRGPGSGMGKTSCRGQKGAGARSGYRRRQGYEGGQFRLFMKLPIRGFSNAEFRKEFSTINLDQIDKIFNDGDTVNSSTLKERGYLSGSVHGLKILGTGQLTKKVKIEAEAISSSAKEKLEKSKVSFTLITKQ